MTQEEKELLYQDLCCRIPYGIKVKYFSTKDFFDCIVQSTNSGETVDLWTKILNKGACFTFVGLDKITPYLFPLSSMTDEQKEEYNFIVNYISPEDTENWAEGEFIYVDKVDALVHFYHKYHLDYRGLIPKGLAKDATNLGIY
jgi:hypothetical protein